MARPSWVLLAAVCLGTFGLWRLLFAIPLLLAGELGSLVPFALLIQGLLALFATAALCFRIELAPLFVVLLGVAVGATALLEAFVWGVRAPLAGLLICVVAVLAALFFARLVRGQRVAGLDRMR